MGMSHDELNAASSARTAALEDRLLGVFNDFEQRVTRAVTGLKRQVDDLDAMSRAHGLLLEKHQEKIAVGANAMEEIKSALRHLDELRSELRLGFQTMAKLITGEVK
jgi:ABC-type transporter Mla subunit MlaD